MNTRSTCSIALAALSLAGCSWFRQESRPLEPLPTLPAMRAEPKAPENRVTMQHDLTTGRRTVTLSSANARASDVLALLAEAAGASIVITPEFADKRVSVYLQDVPAAVALAKVIESVTGGPAGTIPAIAATPPVFYDLPVNINSASAQAISIRFRTSTALADWVVASRLK